MKKKGYAIQMSTTVPDAEKRVAEKASESFEELNAKLKLASDHLNTLYVSFSGVQPVDNKVILDQRVVLREFRDRVKKNFEDIESKTNNAAVLMGEFATDTETVEMMNSFLSQFKDLEKQVNRFLALFSNIGGDDNFMSAVLASIELIRKQSSQFRQLISDRILEHIDTNILAKKWTSNVVDDNQNKVYEKLPLLVRLYKEKNEATKSSG
jgi:hypothetical protein